MNESPSNKLTTPLPSNNMSPWKHVLLSIGLCATISSTQAGTIDSGYQVATWQGFRDAAISYTFDDGTPKQFEVAVPMFSEEDLRLTLFTVTESSWAFPGWEKLQAAANLGHEVASHTATHPNLSELTIEEQRTELEGPKTAISENISANPGLTIAYPFCVPGDPQLVSENYIAARVCSGGTAPTTPPDFLRIDSISCGSLGSVNSLQDFQTTATNALNQSGWTVYLLHGVDDDGGYSPISSETLQASVDFFVENKATYWVDTFGNVARYIKERDDVSVTETTVTDEQINLTVSDTLDDSIYNHPLSIRRVLPENWPAAQVAQNGTSIPSKILTVDSQQYLQFEVTPDSGDISITLLDSRPQIAIENNHQSGQLSIQLQGATGLFYKLLSATDLQTWTTYQAQSVQSPATIEVEVTSPKKFFRAELDPDTTESSTPGGISIASTHPNIAYSGRSLANDDGSITFGHSGARITAKFEGTSIAMKMDDETGNNFVNIFLDGERTGKIALDAQDDHYLLAEDLSPGEHTIEVVRATEAFIGLNHFSGFEIAGPEAKLLGWTPPTDRKIEFIGDSITCGYGVEVDDPNIPFEAATENFSLGYSGLVARELEADYLVVSRSGIGMFRNYDGPFEGSENTMPDVYPDTFYLKPELGVWDSSQFTPDVVCLNLGTNDFSTTGVNVAKFTAAHVEFSKMLLDRYPETQLVLLQGPMQNGVELQSALQDIQSQLSQESPNRVHYFELSAQGTVGWGADWHPNQDQSKINAAELTAFLRDIMDWE